MDYYLLTAHGTIREETFIPSKNQTLVFFTLPGDIATLEAGLQLLYDTNTVTQKCINKKKKKVYNEQLKTCQVLSPTECQSHSHCRLRGKSTKKRRKCLPNNTFYEDTLELLSNQPNLVDKCQNLQCEICNILTNDYNYNISIWNKERIEEEGRGVPDLSLAFNPLFNNEYLYKYGVYKLPNTSLNEYKKNNGNNLLTRSKFNRKIGISPNTQPDDNSDYRKQVIDEIFKGSLPYIYDRRDKLVNQEEIRLSSLLEDLPEGVYFVLACRRSYSNKICKAPEQGHKLFYFNLDNKLFQANQSITKLISSNPDLYCFSNNINRVQKFVQPVYKIKEIKQLHTSDVNKYTVGGWFQKYGKIINIQEDRLNSPKGTIHVESTQYLPQRIPNPLCQFLYSYNFIREYFDLVDYTFMDSIYSTVSKNIYLLRDDNTNYGENTWLESRITDFIPNIFDIDYLRNRLDDMPGYLSLFYYGANFVLGTTNVFRNGLIMRARLSRIFGNRKIIKYLDNEYGETKQIDLFMGRNVPAQILWNAYEWLRIPHLLVQPEWRDFIRNIEDIERYNKDGIYDTLMEFLNTMHSKNGIDYNKSLQWFTKKDGLNVLTELAQSCLKGKWEGMFKQYKNLSKETSFFPFDSLTSYTPYYDVLINGHNYLLNLAAYPFFYDQEVIVKKEIFSGNVLDSSLMEEEFDEYLQLQLNPLIELKKGSRLAIFCNEPNIFSKSECIQEWKTLSQFRNYAHKAIIGTIQYGNQFKRDDRKPDLDLNTFLNKLFDKKNYKNSLLQFIRLPYGDKLDIGKLIWLREWHNGNPKGYDTRELSEFKQHIIQKVHLKGITDPPSIMVYLRLLDIEAQRIKYVNLIEEVFLFEDEISLQYPTKVALQRQGSFKRRKQ